MLAQGCAVWRAFLPFRRMGVGMWRRSVEGAVLALVFQAAAGSEGPPGVQTWADLDAVAAAGFAGLTNACDRHLAGEPPLRIHEGFCTFDPDGDFASVTGRLAATTWFGVRVWQVSVAETADPHTWLFADSRGTVFRTNEAPPACDQHAFVLAAYGAPPPGHLAGAALDRWYADRDRTQVRLEFALVAAPDWPLLQAARDAVAAGGSSAPRAPVRPADPGRLALAGLELGVAPAGLRVWIYAPDAGIPVDLLRRSDFGAGGWSLLETVRMSSVLDAVETAAAGTSAFFRAARADSDTDGDGVPDGREILLFGTDPLANDSDGDGRSDFKELYVCATDPRDADTTPPAIVFDSPAVGERRVLLP